MRSVRVPAEKEMVDTFVAWLLAPAADGTPHEMARRLGIMYVIWDNRMIRMYDPGRGWTNYRNCLDPRNSGTNLDTSCHRNHVHLSMSWDGAAGLTSWWTGVPQTQPYCARTTTAAARGVGVPRVVADPGAIPGFVAVPPTTVLDTAAGLGAGLAAPCRVLAGRALYPRATAPGVVPAGAAEVVLSVTSTSNAPARLAGWSPGALRPAGQVATAIGTTTATLVLPLASDGTVALGTSLGAANISASVVGYVPTALAAAAPTSAPQVQRPSRPRSVRAVSARRAVTTSWRAPARAGGAAVTGYRVQALRSRKRGASVAGTCLAPESGRACTVKGLKKGRKYWMSVSVANAAGSTWAPRKRVRVR